MPQRAKPAPLIPESRWEAHKKRIIGFYINDDLKLEDMIKKMKEVHGFTASKAQYYSKLRAWKIAKNAKRKHNEGSQGEKRRRLQHSEAPIAEIDPPSLPSIQSIPNSQYIPYGSHPVGSGPIEKPVSLLEEEPPADAETTNDDSSRPAPTRQPIHEAIMTGNTEAAKLLLQFAPAVIAVAKGHEQIARPLCEHGADINRQNSLGWTALHYAAVHARLEITTFLVRFGADVDVQNLMEWTPLYYASRECTIGIVKQLVEAGVKSMGTEERPIHCAADMATWKWSSS
ncbi:ankyrin repeat-containing domain protein [Apodospora peruviana]|uniref:Ankyrin repeat-containing domain protein n=1 Tax=Apodospora peruviana TaxID=516989 RepID=A0AAE0I1M3_9PEZI|nr:ankyrin repeat-containing domain protein [Apodospora peruviana]